MNSTLIHTPYLQYSGPAETDYLAGRDCLNASAVAAEDLLHCEDRPKAGQLGSSITQPLNVPYTKRVGYGGSHAGFAGSSFPSSSALLLSPPDSCRGDPNPASTGLESISASITYSTPPLLYPSHATSADHHYSNTASSFLHQPWTDNTMSAYRFRDSALPPPSLSTGLSPSLTYGVTNTIPSSQIGAYHRGESYTGHYSLSRNPYGMAYPGVPERHDSTFGLQAHSRVTDTFPFPPNGLPTMGDSVANRTSAPRQEGPPFEETQILHQVLTSHHQALSPDIVASIQKGFFQVDGKWTCYRRNYFTVTCSFNFRPSSGDGPYYLQRQSSTDAITNFAVQISAKTAVPNGSTQESETRGLVQHTPKRDKATESVPKEQIIQPTPPTPPNTSTLPATSGLYHTAPPISSGLPYDYSGAYGSTQSQSPPTSHTFERIQFQKATANNGKRRAQQQFFNVVVELLANMAPPSRPKPHYVTIATRQSSPMVVRGRSPGHYKDNGRRDSTTSMDPDRGAGAGGDGGGGVTSMSHLMAARYNNTHSAMEWEASRNASAGGFHRSYFGQAQEVEPSSASVISDDSPTGQSPNAHDDGLEYLPNGSLLSALSPSPGDLLATRKCAIGSMLQQPQQPSSASPFRGAGGLNLSLSLPQIDFGIYGSTALRAVVSS